MRRTGVLVCIALAGMLVAPLVLGGSDVLWQASRLPASGYLMLLAVIVTCWLARALKLQLLLHRFQVQPGFSRTFAISLATDFAFITTPGGVAGYAASIYYAKREGATASEATAITAADQLLDLAFFALALPFSGLTLVWSDLPPALTLLTFGASALMITLGAGVLFARRKLLRLLIGNNWIVRCWPNLRRQQNALGEFFSNVGVHMRQLRGCGRMSLFALAVLTAVQWMTRYGTLWVVLSLLGQHVSFALTLLLQSLVLHAAMWTGVPSGGGGAELGLSAALASWVPVSSMAIALLLWRITTFHVCLLAGAIAVSQLALRRSGGPQMHTIGQAATEESAA